MINFTVTEALSTHVITLSYAQGGQERRYIIKTVHHVSTQLATFIRLDLENMCSSHIQFFNFKRFIKLVRDDTYVDKLETSIGVIYRATIPLSFLQFYVDLYTVPSRFYESLNEMCELQSYMHIFLNPITYICL